MESKTCSSCKTSKPQSEFFADKAKKDGRASTCKDCSRERAKRWAQENRERYNQTSRERDHRKWEQHKAAKKAWRDANRESLNARNKAWRNENPEKQKLAVDRWMATNRGRKHAARLRHYQENQGRYADNAKAWAAGNPEKIRSYRHRRRLLEVSAVGAFSGDDVKALLVLQKGRCAYCRCDISDRYHIDHIHPLSKGGSNDKSNIQLLCVTCNHRKSAKDPIQFAQENGRLL